MIAPYTQFGKTLTVEADIYQFGKKIDSQEWDEDWWVERGEDWYGLDLKGKRIRVITRENWLRAVRTQGNKVK